jgi:hypothetical protein
MGSGGVGSGLTGAIGGMLGGMGGVPQQMAMGGMPHMGGPGVGLMGNGMMGGGGMAPQVAPTGHPPMVGAGNTGHMLRGPGASQAGPGGAPSAVESEADAYARHIDGQLLTGLLCAALYPQIIAIEREETKKKKGINAPMKLRIRDKNDVSEEGAPEPTEVAIHPSSVNTKETKFNGMTCTRNQLRSVPVLPSRALSLSPSPVAHARHPPSPLARRLDLSREGPDDARVRARLLTSVGICPHPLWRRALVAAGSTTAAATADHLAQAPQARPAPSAAARRCPYHRRLDPLLSEHDRAGIAGGRSFQAGRIACIKD